MELLSPFFRSKAPLATTRSGVAWWFLAALLTTLIFSGLVDFDVWHSGKDSRVHHGVQTDSRVQKHLRADFHENQKPTEPLQQARTDSPPSVLGELPATVAGLRSEQSQGSHFAVDSALSALGFTPAPSAKGGGFGGGGSGSRRGPYGSRSSYGGGGCVGCLGCGGGLSFIIFVFVVIFIFSAISRGVTRTQYNRSSAWQSNSFSRGLGSMPNWDSMDWSDMSPTQRRNWETLGWSRSSWSGMSPAPATDDLSWYQLSPAQQRAARALGYTQHSWDTG